MKYLKWPLIVLVGLAVIYSILCAVGPKNVNVTRELKMKAKPAHVYNLVHDLKEWNTWSSWAKNDSTMITTYPGKTLGVGAISKWTSDEQGAGSQEIIEAEKNRRLKTRLAFDGWDGYSYGEFNIVPDGNETNVSWSMSGDKDFSFLQRGMMLLMGFKGSIKKNYDESLRNLKAIVEPRAKGIYDGYKINRVEIPEKSYVMNRAEVKTSAVGQFFNRNLGGLANKVGEARLIMDGMPSALFFKWDDESRTTDMAAAIPVKEGAEVDGYTTLTIPAKNALQIDYYGDSSKSAKAHNALDAYLNDNSLLSDRPIVEEYVTDPGTEKDPTKWLTKITYYLAE